MKKFFSLLFFLLAITGCQVNKEENNVKSPPTPPELEKNNTKLQTPPNIPNLN